MTSLLDYNQYINSVNQGIKSKQPVEVTFENGLITATITWRQVSASGGPTLLFDYEHKTAPIKIADIPKDDVKLGGQFAQKILANIVKENQNNPTIFLLPRSDAKQPLQTVDNYDARASNPETFYTVLKTNDIGSYVSLGDANNRKLRRFELQNGAIYQTNILKLSEGSNFQLNLMKGVLDDMLFIDYGPTMYSTQNQVLLEDVVRPSKPAVDMNDLINSYIAK